MAHGRVFPAVSLQGSGECVRNGYVHGRRIRRCGRGPAFRSAMSPSGLRHRAHALRRGARRCWGVCASARWRCWVRAPRMRSTAPGPVPAASGPRAPTGARVPQTVPDCGTATFTNNGPTSVTISNSTSINTIEFDVAAPAYSFTVQNGATFTINNQISPSSSLLPAFTVSTGATLAIGDGAFAEIGSLAGGGNVVVGPSDPSTTLIIAGSNSTTFSGTSARARSKSTAHAGADSVRARWRCADLNGATVAHDRRKRSSSRSQPARARRGNLYHRRRLADRQRYGGFGNGVTVEGGTLSVINGGTLQIGNLRHCPAISCAQHVIAAPARRDGERIYRRRHLRPGRSISNGGVLNSQGGARSMPWGPSTVTVTGRLDLECRRSAWRLAAAARSAGPEYSPFPMAASSMPHVPWASAIPTGPRRVTGDRRGLGSERPHFARGR